MDFIGILCHLKLHMYGSSSRLMRGVKTMILCYKMYIEGHASHFMQQQ